MDKVVWLPVDNRMKREALIALAIGIAVGLVVSVSSVRVSEEAKGELNAARATRRQAEQLQVSIDKARERRPSSVGELERARQDLLEVSAAKLDSVEHLLDVMITIRPLMVFVVITCTVSILILKFMEQRQHAKRLEESEKVLRLQNDELETIARQRERFIATLAHDMKVPLVGADLVFGLIMDEKVSLEERARAELLQKLRENNADVLAKLQDMIQIYRYENPELFRHIGAANMAELVQRCVDRVIPFAQLQGVNISTALLTNVDCEIDVPGVERTIVSLLDNALKASTRGSTVAISMIAQDKQLRIRIADSGKGISQEEQTRLFSGVSSRGSDGSRYAGNGLGLYLAKLVVDAHKGSIDCLSELGKGSTFTVSLPVVNSTA